MKKELIKERKIVIVNQAVNYLTVGVANAFADRFEDVSLITGNIHEQDEKIYEHIKVHKISRYDETSLKTKFMAWVKGLFQIYFLLLTKYRKHEVFFVSVPPNAYFTFLLLRGRFSVLVWDVYPDNLKIFGISEKHPLYKFWGWANRRLFRRAYKMYTISEKMADLVSSYIAREELIITPLWTTFKGFDPIKRSDNFFVKEHGLENKFVVQYSGNIGTTHNVEVLVEVARELKNEEHIEFLIIGKGVRVPKLKKMIKEYGLTNTKILPFQPDDVFPYSLSSADLGVVILDDITSKGSVPSKTYNLMAMGIPVLYVASPDSQLKIYADTYKNGACFHASDIPKIAKFVEHLSTDKGAHARMSENSKAASENYKRGNADVLVDRYID